MNELISAIDVLLKKIITETLEIEKEKTDCQKFYYEVLFVNIRLFEGALFLLGQFKDSPHLQVSFVSVMRDIISNLILVEYVHQKENDPSANIAEELEKIYSEHYRFKRKNKKIESILFNEFENYAQIEEYFDRLGEKYNSADGQIKLHLKNIQSTYQRIRYVESKLKKHEKPGIRTLYLWFTEFSKIAHFGELTIHQIATGYHLVSEKEVMKKFGYLIITVTKYIVTLLIKLIHPDLPQETITKDFEKILEFESNV